MGFDLLNAYFAELGEIRAEQELKIKEFQQTVENKKNQQEYDKNLIDKKDILGNIAKIRKKDPMDKLQSYEPIKIETENLLIREKILFTINSVVIVGLIFGVYSVI
jgi:hypothetical protein